VLAQLRGASDIAHLKRINDYLIRVFNEVSLETF
jgi:hypothetical protein